MPTASSSALLTVSLGVPITTTLGVTFHGIGTAGTYGALRRLVHPNTSLAPVVYLHNPPVYHNIGTDVLVAPIINTVMTLDDTKVIRFERLQKDMIVEEFWPGSRQSPSMPTAFFQHALRAEEACSQKIHVKRMSKVIERGFWILPRSLFNAVKFRIQSFISNAVLLHCFPCLRLGLLEPFPMYAAFPRSDYYGSSAPMNVHPRSPRIARLRNGRTNLGSHVLSLDLRILR